MPHKNYITYYLILATNYLTKICRDIMVPALPVIAVYYGTSPAVAKQTLGWYFLGISCSRLLWPAIADEFCKRRLLLVMHLMFIIASIICIHPSSVVIFTSGRFLQAFTISSIPIIIRSIIYQQRGSRSSMQLYGYLSPLSSWSPAVAIAIGSVLIGHFDLPILSLALVVFALVNMLALLQLPKQALATPKARSLPKIAIMNYINVAKNREFWWIALPFAILTAGNALYLAFAAYLLLEPGILTLAEFGVAGFLVMTGQVVGRMSAGFLADKISIRKLLFLAPISAVAFSLSGYLLSTNEVSFSDWFTLSLIAGNYFAIGLITIVAKACIGDIMPQRVTSSLGLMNWLESICSFALIFVASWISSTFTALFAILLACAVAALLCCIMLAPSRT